MALHKMIFAGFGGQGIMLIGQMLAYGGMREGKEVTFLPSYGPEMRGGTANCTVIVSDQPVSCPIIDKATCVVAMNQPSMAKFEAVVEKGGDLFLNSSLIDADSGRDDVKVHKVDVTELAKKEGNDRVANIIMLGAVIERTKAIKPETIEKLIEETFSGAKASLQEVNIKAFNLGRSLK